MLPGEWKSEIKEAIDEAARCSEDSQKRKEEGQKAIASPLNRFVQEFVNYINEQRDAEPGKRRREKATIAGIGITGIFTIILAIATIGLYCATHALVIDAKHTAELQLRAFVYMQLTGFDGRGSPDGTIRWVSYAQIGNSGSTSSRKLSYAFACTTDPTLIFDMKNLDANNIESFAVGPGVKEGSREACIRSDGEIAKYIAAGTHLYVFGRVRYWDMFQKDTEQPRVTEFCVDHFEFSRTVGGPSEAKAPGINARSRPCPQGHNCNDKDCAK